MTVTDVDIVSITTGLQIARQNERSAELYRRAAGNNNGLSCYAMHKHSTHVLVAIG